MAKASISFSADELLLGVPWHSGCLCVKAEETVVLARDEEWISITELGSPIDNLKIKTLEEISLFSLAIKESEMTDFFSWEQLYMTRV
ncbi:hypothetical protein U0070_019162 [Myodes glareolus]|uniref:Uncharacterized protein n=1 Tax=Myodes glareolus TaxID=447135 RepID=A0AAW0ILL4_MYOGA